LPHFGHFGFSAGLKGILIALRVTYERESCVGLWKNKKEMKFIKVVGNGKNRNEVGRRYVIACVSFPRNWEMKFHNLQAIFNFSSLGGPSPCCRTEKSLLHVFVSDFLRVELYAILDRSIRSLLMINRRAFRISSKYLLFNSNASSYSSCATRK